MKPIKSIIPVAKWLLRVAAVAIVYSNGHIGSALGFSFNGLLYFIALTYTILVLLLMVGAFLKSSKLTVISGLLLLVICLIDLFALTGFSVPNLLSILPLATIGFYFMAQGNS